jgi:hypothetical protein
MTTDPVGDEMERQTRLERDALAERNELRTKLEREIDWDTELIYCGYMVETVFLPFLERNGFSSQIFRTLMSDLQTLGLEQQVELFSI